VLLRYPDQRKMFYVQTDSSGYGLGAELYQIQEDGSRGVIAFASRSLKGPELNYTTTEKELLGVIFALHKFRIYIQATKIIIRTDHQVLKFLSRCQLLSERLTRWTLQYGQYDYEIELVKGKDNVVADILSRYPSDGEASYEYPREQPIVAMFEVHNTPEMLQLISDLQQHQTDDPVLRPIIENKRSGGAAPDSRTQRVWAQYNLTNNVLVHRSQNSNDDCIAVPESLIIKLVDYHHQLLGHFGSTKVYNSMKGEYYWPNMYRSIKKRLRSCDLCQKTKCSNRPHQGPLTPILYDHVGDLVCVDFYGPLPTGRLGASYVFVVIDAFSKFLKLYPLRKATAKVAAKRLIENYAGYIKPKCALSDHGTQFLSSTWENSLRAADIQPTLSSIRHPESNPSERVMPELGRIFRAYCRENHASWVNHLNNIEDCLNYVPHISTGFSPHEILYGRKPPNPLDAVTSGLLPQRAPHSREEIHAKVRENLRHHANLRQRNQKGETTILELDDWVLLKNKVTSDTRTQQFAKFMPLYRGPYKIIAKLHPNTYQIADPVSNEIKGVYNMTNMTCNSTTDETNKSAKSSSSAIPGHIHSSERTDSPRRIHHSGASTIPAHPPVLPSTRCRLPTMRCLTPHLRSNARPEANVMNAVFTNFILFPSRKIFIFNSTNSDLSLRPPNCFCSIYEIPFISILNTHMFCKYQNVEKNRAVPTKCFLEFKTVANRKIIFFSFFQKAIWYFFKLSRWRDAYRDS
jgi:transposase InsO family protein